MSTMTENKPEILIDRWTREGHQRFMANLRFDTERGLMTWHEWLEWMRTRDPIAENPAEAKRVLDARLDAEAERRNGPGISRRVPTQKKAAPKS